MADWIQLTPINVHGEESMRLILRVAAINGWTQLSPHLAYIGDKIVAAKRDDILRAIERRGSVTDVLVSAATKQAAREKWGEIEETTKGHMMLRYMEDTDLGDEQ